MREWARMAKRVGDQVAAGPLAMAAPERVAVGQR